MSNEFNEQELP